LGALGKAPLVNLLLNDERNW